MNFDKRKVIVCIFIYILFPLNVLAGGDANIILKVIDESGNPIENALVRIAKGGATKKEAFKGVTNSEGIFIKTIDTPDGMVGGAVIKDGYYKSDYHHIFYKKRFGRWQPWEKEITVVMRPIINPVPMYMLERFFEIPEHDKEIGFDLFAADWVEPYGKGTVSDFIFIISRDFESIDQFDAIMSIKFNNEYDGIIKVIDDRGGIYGIGSIFRLPRIAPEEGYVSSLIKKSSAGISGWHSDNKDDINYIFRVRSEVDNDGKLVKAIYGKILGDIRFVSLAGKKGGFKMRYYLNPDWTRNLEFDPKRNLFSEKNK
jgi:hypothetical protein